MFRKSNGDGKAPKLLFGIGLAYGLVIAAIVGFVAWRQYDGLQHLEGAKKDLALQTSLSKLSIQAERLTAYTAMLTQASRSSEARYKKKLNETLGDWQENARGVAAAIKDYPDAVRNPYGRAEQQFQPMKELFAGAVALANQDASFERRAGVARQATDRLQDYSEALTNASVQLNKSASGIAGLEQSLMITGGGAIGGAVLLSLFLFLPMFRKTRKSIEFDMARYLTAREREFSDKIREASEKTMQELQAKQAEMEAQAEALEVALSRAEEVNRLKTAFLANMSHEIRTPMNHVIGMAELMAQTNLLPEQRDWLRTIISSGNQLVNLINDILDMSQVEAGKLALDPKPLNIQEVITEAVRPFEEEAKAKGIPISVWLAAGTKQNLVSDPVRIRQVLTNLIGNAIKFTHEGRIDVAGETVQIKDSISLRISVKDTGIGIEPDRLDAIFESFTQADTSTKRTYGGTGLGLTIVKQIAELMGGTVHVKSTLGRGSEFTVVIPVEEQLNVKTDREEVPTMTDELPDLALRCLVVEDNPVNQKVLVKLLEKLGCAVDKVDDGEAAIQKTLANTYDLILMDIHMPGKDGIEATKEIRQREAQWGRDRTPIVAVTADAMQEDRDRFMEAGMDDYLPKPVRQATLVPILSKFCKAFAA